MKKILSVTLALSLTVGIFTGCGKSNEPAAKGDSSANSVTSTKSDMPDYLNAEEFPIVKNKITLKLMGSKSPIAAEWKDMEVMKRMESLTNISFNYDTPLASGYTERKNLSFASQDLPDVFFLGAISVNDEETYGPQGVLQPLDKYIDKYAPRFKKILDKNPDIKKAITASDGHIYSMPYIVRTKTTAANILYMNTEWLQKVNMKKLATVDEMYQVLKAFKEKDPNGNGKQDEIPLSYWKQNPAGTAANIPGILHGVFYAAFSGQAGGAGFDIKDNKVIYNPMQPAFKDYMAYMRKLYAEGLLDSEMFTQTQQQYIAKYKEGKMGVSSISLSSVLNPGQNAPYELIQPLTSTTNSKKVTSELPGINSGAFALTKNCKYPEAMVRWADVFFREVDENVEGISGLSMFLGIYKFNWEFTDNTRTQYKRESKVEGLTPVDYINKHVMPGGFGWVVTDAVPNTDPLLLLKATESEKNYYPYTIPIYPATVRLSADQSQRATFLQNDINTYVEQMIAKFILGEEPIDKFDSYVSKLKQMNIEELIKIRQDGYDKWNKSK